MRCRCWPNAKHTIKIDLKGLKQTLKIDFKGLKHTVNAEVDYVLGLNGQVLPVEIKSGASGSLKSLHQFAGEKAVARAVRFYTAPPAQQEVKTYIRKANSRVEVSYELLSLPLYLVEALPNIC